MKVNVPTWERIARAGAGAALLYLGWAGIVSGGWGTLLKVAGFVPFLTGTTGFCPAYALLGIQRRTA